MSRRIQRKIDEKTHDQRLFESTLRILFCDFCQHANLRLDGDDTICARLWRTARSRRCGGISKLAAIGPLRKSFATRNIAIMSEYIVQKALDDLHNRSMEDLVDLVTREVVKKLSQEYDLSIPENVEKAKAVMDERIAELLNRFRA